MANDNDNPDFRTVLHVSGELPKGTKQGTKVKGYDRLYKTQSPHTYIIEPKQDEPEDEEDMDAVFQDPEPEPPKQKKASRTKAQAQPAPSPKLVDVQVELAGFGTVPTKYTAFDEGAGCLRIEVCDQSWIPPRAERDDDGRLTGGFSFASLPGKTWFNVGLEFRDRIGKRNIILIQGNGNAD